jgi:hypothetical protein
MSPSLRRGPKAALAGLLFFLLEAGGLWAADPSVLVLDCRQSKVPQDFTSQAPTVYLPGKDFDASQSFRNGEISPGRFDKWVKSGWKKAGGQVRLRTRKGDEIDVYIVTSVPMMVFQQPQGAPIPSPQLVTQPLIFTVPPRSGPSQALTVESQPLTISYLPTARFIIQEKRRQGELEAGNFSEESYQTGVLFKPAAGDKGEAGNERVCYFYAVKYPLKCDNGIVRLSFSDPIGNQQQVASLLTGPSQNWFLTAGGPLYSLNLNPNDTTGNPVGLYVGLNWSPKEIDDPSPRWFIANFLDVNTTNPSAGLGLVGVGIGFPKIGNFIPLSTLSVTETLFFNFNSSQFQLLTLATYDVSDIFQFLKL